VSRRTFGAKTKEVARRWEIAFFCWKCTIRTFTTNSRAPS